MDLKFEVLPAYNRLYVGSMDPLNRLNSYSYTIVTTFLIAKGVQTTL